MFYVVLHGVEQSVVLLVGLTVHLSTSRIIHEATDDITNTCKAVFG